MKHEFAGSWGKAKVEVTASWSEISDFLKNRYPLAEIHRILTARKKITIAQRTFYAAVRELEAADSGTSRTQQPRPKVSSQKAVVAASTGSGTGKFKFDPTEKVDF